MRRVILPILFAAACGGTETTTAHGQVADPIAPERRTIGGTSLWSYEQVDGTDNGSLADDLHSWVIEAHFPTDEGWEVVPGYGLSDGTFTIPDAPDGGYWLRVVTRPAGQQFLWTDASSLALGGRSIGPLEHVFSPAEAPIVLRADGLSPWEEEDALAFYAPDAGNVDASIFWEAEEGQPAAGDTSLELGFNWNARPQVRVEEGHPAFVVQSRVLESDGGIGYRAAVAAYRPDDVVQPLDGSEVVLAGTFSSPPALDFALAWDRGAWEGLGSSIHPTRTQETLGFGHAVFAHPGAREDGSLLYGFEFPVFEMADPAAFAGAEDLGAFSVPNPYPASWVMQTFSVSWQVEVPFPVDDGEPRFLEAVVARRSRTLSSEAAPLVPLVGPVGEVRLDGASLDTDRDGVSPLAELSFDPPAIGTPTSYQVQVAEALLHPPEPYQPGWYLVANLRLPADVTSVRMPHNLLRPGGSYVLVVRAVQEEGQDLRQAPARNGVESAIADRVTSVFTVAAE